MWALHAAQLSKMTAWHRLAPFSLKGFGLPADFLLHRDGAQALACASVTDAFARLALEHIEKSKTVYLVALHMYACVACTLHCRYPLDYMTFRCLVFYCAAFKNHTILIPCHTGVPGSHPNIVLGMLGRRELRTPSIPKSHPKSFGQCKRNTNVDRMNS